MKSFFINTATKISTISLLNDFELIDSMTITNNKDLSSYLFGYIQDLFSRNKVSPEDIDKIFVSIGPGSFTGIRIGLTVAKTWSSLYKIPLYSISTLEILASVNRENSYSCSLIDARRNYVYAGIYDSSLNVVFPDTYISLDDICDQIKNLPITFCTYDSFDFVPCLSDKINVTKLVKKHWNDEPVNSHILIPIYLKKTEAEERFKND